MLINWKRVSIATGIGASVLAALASYSALDGPLPATNHELAAVEKYAEDTREIILLDKLFQRQEELNRAERAYRQNPDNLELERRVNDLKRQIQLLERQLEQLGASDASA